MLVVYGIPNCNSVKKAIDWLKTKNIAYEFHDYKKKGISQDKIEEWLGVFPKEKLVNKVGTTFRQLSDEEKKASFSEEGAISLMLEKNSVIKRPLIEKDGKALLLGFDEEKYARSL